MYERRRGFKARYVHHADSTGFVFSDRSLPPLGALYARTRGVAHFRRLGEKPSKTRVSSRPLRIERRRTQFRSSCTLTERKWRLISPRFNPFTTETIFLVLYFIPYQLDHFVYKLFTSELRRWLSKLDRCPADSGRAGSSMNAVLSRTPSQNRRRRRNVTVAGDANFTR